MKLPLLLVLSGIMFGCTPTTQSPSQQLTQVQSQSRPRHPDRDTCLTIYWRMLGMEIRERKIPGREYSDKELSTSLNNLHERMLTTGGAQRTVNSCMQLNVLQATCMIGAWSLPEMAICEHRYESKEHK